MTTIEAGSIKNMSSELKSTYAFERPTIKPVPSIGRKEKQRVSKPWLLARWY